METATASPSAVSVDGITIETIHDSHSDPNEYLFQDEEYREEDQQRLDSWRNDNWYFIGIRATAKISAPIGSAGTRLMQTINSGGLWGIESDSERACFEEVAREQLAELREALDALNVDLTEFEALAAEAITDATYPYANA